MNDTLSCDTSVVTGSITAGGSVIFAKNSDRSVNECQPLVHVPRATNAEGETARCQYIAIPQVATTWEMIGSRPYWLWGFEMGVNEWGVTIGNEAVQTREPTHEQALIGMDLVRLGLERGKTAEEAVTVIGELVESYGQGGSCEAVGYRTYQNSFIVADAVGAWVLETAGHRWVARQVRERAAISNLLTIDGEWDAGSAGVREHAIGQGWWGDDGSFARAYQDPGTDLAPRACRLERARFVLGGHMGPVGVPEMMALLRDHSDKGLPTGPDPLPTICMHANPAFPGETAASMVVQIRPDRPQLLTTTCWTAFGSPCLSVFRPVYPFAVGLPDCLGIGSKDYDPRSPWWVFERLQRLIARAPGAAEIVRSAFRDLELEFVQEAAAAEQVADRHLLTGDNDEAVVVLRDLVDSTTKRVLALADRLTIELEAASDAEPIPELAAFWDGIDEAVGLLVSR